MLQTHAMRIHWSIGDKKRAHLRVAIRSRVWFTLSPPQPRTQRRLALEVFQDREMAVHAVNTMKGQRIGGLARAGFGARSALLLGFPS